MSAVMSKLNGILSNYLFFTKFLNFSRLDLLLKQGKLVECHGCSLEASEFDFLANVVDALRTSSFCFNPPNLTR